MSAENVEIVNRIQAALTDEVVAALTDPEIAQRIAETLAECAEPDFECAMVGPDYLPRADAERGPAGLGALWQDWASPFVSLRIEVEEMIDAGDKVVSLVRQVGRTKTGGVAIEADAAAVWFIAGGRLRRVEFHLDRGAALRAAGLDPQSGQA